MVETSSLQIPLVSVLGSAHLASQVLVERQDCPKGLGVASEAMLQFLPQEEGLLIPAHPLVQE